MGNLSTVSADPDSSDIVGDLLRFVGVGKSKVSSSPRTSPGDNCSSASDHVVSSSSVASSHVLVDTVLEKTTRCCFSTGIVGFLLEGFVNISSIRVLKITWVDGVKSMSFFTTG